MTNGADTLDWRDALDMFLLDLQQALVAPASNPALAVLSLFIVLTLLAMLVLLVVSIYLFVTSKGEGIRWVRPKTTRREKWINRGLLLLLLVTIAIPFTHYTQADRNCLNCHSDGAHKTSLQESEHADQRCISCHMRPGISGFVQQKVDFARWTYVYIATEEVPPTERLRGNVADASCLKCHRAVLREPSLIYNLRVSHQEIHDAASRCIDCHNQVAHPGVTTPVRVANMATCLLCHEGNEASSECSVCHTEDYGEGVRPARRDFPQRLEVDVAWDFCYDCHDESNECLPCHGVTMPHPPNWEGTRYVWEERVVPGHARPAAFTAKQVCWRCHYSERGPFTQGDAFCEQCHQIQVHGPDAQTFWSHRRYDARECTGLCHAARTCTENCHTLREPVQLPPGRNYPFNIPSIGGRIDR